MRLHKNISLRLAAIAAGLVLTVSSTAGFVHKAAADTTYAPSVTQISDTPTAWTTTNGDVLDSVVFANGSNHYVAITGNFTAVTTPDGVSHPAKNFAVLREETGELIYNGNANSYPRFVRFVNGILYTAGDFTNIGGQARQYIAAIDTNTWKVTSWNPGSHSKVMALDAGPSRVFYGTGSGVYAVSAKTGQTLWFDRSTGGPVRSLLLNPEHTMVYVGGMFVTVGGFTNHGLMRVNNVTGAPDRSYTPYVVPNSGQGHAGSYDGQNVLNMVWDTNYSPARLYASIGGKQNNLIAYHTDNSDMYWEKWLIGDGQDVVTVGDVAIVGTHRSWFPDTANDQGDKWYDAAYRTSDGAAIAWDARVSGMQGGNVDKGNTGIQTLSYSKYTNRVYVMGAFTTWNATCTPSTVSCTGGTPQKSIAVFSYK